MPAVEVLKARPPATSPGPVADDSSGTSGCSVKPQVCLEARVYISVQLDPRSTTSRYGFSGVPK